MHRIVIDVTDELYANLNSRALELKLNVSAFVRLVLSGHEPVPIIPATKVVKR